jgi:hypothetical protein
MRASKWLRQQSMHAMWPQDVLRSSDDAKSHQQTRQVPEDFEMKTIR